MMTSPLILLASATALLMTGTAAAAQSQETNNSATAAPPPSTAVGNPQLRDFELPGTRTTPPAATQPVQPPAAQPEPSPPAAQRTPSAPASTAPAPRPATPAQRPQAQSTAPAAPVAPPPTNIPEPQDVLEALPSPAPAAPAPVPLPSPETAPVVDPAPVESGSSFPWLYVGLGLLAALLGLAAFAKLRRKTEAEDLTPVEQEPVPEPVQTAQPPAPPAPRSDVVGIQMRPWIEIEFVPARASTTPTEANVQFELKIRNTGSAPARNVRIEVRMFNAGPNQEREITDFYGEPIRERTQPALAMLPAKTEAQVSSAVAMPKENLREVMVQGRRLFIPTVAFNIVYDWGNGKSGQTSASYLVGREAETPTEKMGAFRLDLGPRIFRSVGQRPTRLARTV